jgi:hypothetical protein
VLCILFGFQSRSIKFLNKSVNLSDKTPSEPLLCFIFVGVWKTAVALRRLSGGKILRQNEQAQACFCGAPPRIGTVCGTVRSSPALERTAFLWNYKQTVYELHIYMNEHSMFILSFPCNKTLLMVFPTFKLRSPAQVLFAIAIALLGIIILLTISHVQSMLD